MKKLSKFVIAFIAMIFINFKTIAQVESNCGTEPASDSIMTLLPWYGNNAILDSFVTAGIQRLAQNNPTSVRSSGNSCPDIDNQLFLPIKFFFIEGDSPNPPSAIEQQELIDRVNDFYQSNGMPFRFYGECSSVIQDGDHLHINNDWEAYWMDQYYHLPFAINVYVADLYDGGLGGVYNSVGDFIVVTNHIFGSEDGATTLSHELGHYFGLEHTFRNIHSDIHCFREVVNRSANFSFGCNLVLKFGKICTKNGDALCDTPADPNTGFSTNCPYSGTETDIRGDLFVPDHQNVMSYFHCGRTNLSDGQKGIMWHNLLLKRPGFLELDHDLLNPDQYEPDQESITAREIKVNESQCHSMQDYCNDVVDYLKVNKIPFIGYYFFEIEDVMGNNNPVDDVKVFNRNGTGSNGVEILTTRTTNNGIRRFAIQCSEITSSFGINIEIKRNNRSQGKYLAKLTKSNNLYIDNNNKECLSEGDQLFIQNLPTGSTVSWSSFKFITFSNNGQGNPVTIVSLNGNVAPITIRATVFQGNGCYEQISKEFIFQIGSNPPLFEINEIEPPCKLHGFVYYEGYYETNPRLNVDWEVSDGTLFPDQGNYTSVKPDQLGWITLSATYNDGCSLPRTVYKQIYVDNCDILNPKLIANPNPSNDQIQVSVENFNLEISEGTIRIIDQNSNIRLQHSATTLTSIIDVSSLQNGVYYLTWTNSQLNLSKMIIVNH